MKLSIYLSIYTVYIYLAVVHSIYTICIDLSIRLCKGVCVACWTRSRAASTLHCSSLRCYLSICLSIYLCSVYLSSCRSIYLYLCVCNVAATNPRWTRSRDASTPHCSSPRWYLSICLSISRYGVSLYICESIYVRVCVTSAPRTRWTRQELLRRRR